MRALYVGGYPFLVKDGSIYSSSAYGDLFWQKYYTVFDSVTALGYQAKIDNIEKMTKITKQDFEVEILPKNNNPMYFFNDRKVRKIIKNNMEKCDCMIIKPTSRKGIIALKLAKKYQMPYMIEVTGDINLSLREHKNIFRKIYRPFLYHRIKKNIRECKYGLYVTKYYLQEVYPILGEMCGCSDVVIPYIDEAVLQQRIDFIQNKSEEDIFNIGLIGTYSDDRKGIDTAIKAIALVPKAKLRILGFGTEEDRGMWKKYAQRYGVEERLVFDNPVSGVDKVFEWIDQIDISILPSRSEGLPRCIVESLSRACPCIISNVCGMPELVDEKWLHSPGDSEKLGRLLNEMIGDKGKMEQAAIENFNRSKGYTKDHLDAIRYEFLSDFRLYVENT